MKDNIKIKERIETITTEAHYDQSFWDDAAGRPGTYYPKSIEKRKYFDVVLNGKVVVSYTHKPHAKEWISDYNNTKNNRDVVYKFLSTREKINDLHDSYNRLVEKYPWLYSHKLNYLESEK